MYWRSFSKPVSGDGKGDAAAVTGVAAGALFETLEEPPHAAPNSTTNIIGPITRILFKARLSQPFFNLLVTNIHDRAFSILINDIKPAAQARMLEKVMMRIIGKHVPRTKPIANQRSRIFFLAECDAIVKLRQARILIK